VKISTKLSGTLAAFILCAATSTFAAGKGSLHISSTVSVAGEKLAPGDYAVRWNGSGPSVELEIVQGKKIVTTAPATMTPTNEAPINNAVIVIKYADGSQEVSQILLAGKQFVFKIGSQPTEAQLKNDN
jgi:hypothetical protein